MSDFKVVQPDGPLFRLARAPDPWKWPDWAYAGLDGTFGNRSPRDSLSRALFFWPLLVSDPGRAAWRPRAPHVGLRQHPRGRSLILMISAYSRPCTTLFASCLCCAEPTPQAPRRWHLLRETASVLVRPDSLCSLSYV